MCSSDLDYAVTVYSQILKKLYPDIPVIIGGIEASLRRLTHYDYWSDSLMPSVLVHSGADYLVYGMGERPIIQLAQMMRNKATLAEFREVPQIAYLAGTKNEIPGSSREILCLPSHEACKKNKKIFAEHFRIIEKQANVSNSPVLAESLDDENGPLVVVNPPFPVMNTDEMDALYELPFTYQAQIGRASCRERV